MKEVINESCSLLLPLRLMLLIIGASLTLLWIRVFKNQEDFY